MFLHWRHIQWSEADRGAVFGLLSLIWVLTLEKRVSSARPLSVQDHQHPGSPAPQPEAPPTLYSLAWGLAHLWVSETKVWLCQVLQTLPKTTRGNTQMDEGVFPERFKFLLSTVLTLAVTQSIFRQMELASLPWP